MSTATTATEQASLASAESKQVAVVKQESLPARTTLSAASLRSLADPSSIFPLLIGVAAFLAIVSAAVLWASGPTYQVLYSNLSDADGGTIISELEQRQIPYQISEGGKAILVPSEEVHKLRLQLAEQGLPKGGKVGFELLDTQAFGVSQFAEQVNFQRGLEGELARSMEALGPVAAARVHLAMAKPSVFINQRQPAKASVVLNLHPGKSLSESQVSAIVHMVASSVPDLTTDNVSVVDQRGELLSQADTKSGLNTTQLKYIAQVEQAYQNRVNNILTPLLGENAYRVQVTADIDFSSYEQTSENYKPNQTPDSSAIRSTQSSTNFSGDEATARGIPGALSNVAPNWAPSPIEGEASDGETGGDGSGNTTLRKDNVVNYEVDRSVIHTKRQMGITERLSVAVVVDHTTTTDEEGNVSSVALPQEELDQITRLVQRAVGFNAERGDQVEVINSPFSEVPEVVIEETPWWKTTLFINTVITALKYLLAGIGILMAYRILVKPVMQKHLSSPSPSAAMAGGGMLGLEDGGDGSAEGADGNPFKRSDKSKTYMQQVNELKKMSNEDPRLIALIARNWMKDDG